MKLIEIEILPNQLYDIGSYLNNGFYLVNTNEVDKYIVFANIQNAFVNLIGLEGEVKKYFREEQKEQKGISESLLLKTIALLKYQTDIKDLI